MLYITPNTHVSYNNHDSTDVIFQLKYWSHIWRRVSIHISYDIYYSKHIILRIKYYICYLLMKKYDSWIWTRGLRVWISWVIFIGHHICIVILNIIYKIYNRRLISLRGERRGIWTPNHQVCGEEADRWAKAARVHAYIFIRNTYIFLYI